MTKLTFLCILAVISGNTDSWILRPAATTGRLRTPFPSREIVTVWQPLNAANNDKKSKGNPEEEEENNTEESQSAKLDEEQAARERRRIEVAKEAAKLMKRPPQEEEENSSFLNKLNPFQAGQKLRKSLDSAISSLARASSSPGALSADGKKSVYYLDDRFTESGGALFPQGNPYLTQLDQDEFIPEILVIGATGEIGRRVVQRLLLEGRSRVRVLVPDLYSKTLNLLGPRVVYCQGDTNNMDSLETALTDVDKIVHINSAPRPDEDAFQEKFMGFAQENLRGSKEELRNIPTMSKEEETTAKDLEWERLGSVLQVRASLAREIDFVGMQNIVKAYQNVRFADYGTSQAAKRSLFKFSSRDEDFNLFMIDDSDNDTTEPAPAPKMPSNSNPSPSTTKSKMGTSGNYEDLYEGFRDEYDEYEQYADDLYGDMYSDATSGLDTKITRDAAVKTQVQWIRNEFGNGVFVGRVPQSTSGGIGGEAAIVSSRLRTRDGGPNDGIDLSVGFGGFVCRLCADGGVYEAFVRDGLYETNGIEYVCEFSTATKLPQKGNASRNKFVTLRLPFESFKPVQRRVGAGVDATKQSAGVFKGKDVRYLGFRYRSSRNPAQKSRQKAQPNNMNSFYIALSYIKLYRVQPEPEFVYLSDARIPPVVMDSQVRHDLHQLVPAEESGTSDTGAYKILDEKSLQQISTDTWARSPEETYYKYRGEEILKASGLSYAIVRVLGYNEAPGSEESTIELKQTNEGLDLVSRSEVAQVCVSALLDPNALNKSFYVSKKRKGSFDETLSAKFSSLPPDPVKR